MCSVECHSVNLTRDRPRLSGARVALFSEVDGLLMLAPVLANVVTGVIGRRQLRPLAAGAAVPRGADVTDLAAGGGADLVKKLHRRKLLQGRRSDMDGA